MFTALVSGVRCEAMNRLSFLLVSSLVAAGAAAQAPIAINTARSNIATAGATSAAAGSGGSSASSSTPSGGAGSSASGATPIGDGTSFAALPGKRDPNKKVVVPASLLPKDEQPIAIGALGVGGVQMSLGDQAKHFQDAKTVAKPQPVHQLVPPLHFDELMSGIDPVSVTVRDFQSYANDHTRHESELAVRKWFKEGSDLAVTNPASMRRKEAFTNSVTVLRSVGFPTDWLEAPKPEASTAK